MDYRDFELLVTPDYRIRADSEQGAVDGQVALDLAEIELALQLVEQERTNATLLKGLGGKLYDGLFPPAVHAHLRATAAVAEALGLGVRLRLILDTPRLEKAAHEVQAHLRSISLADRRWGWFLDTLGSLAFNLLALAVLVLIFLLWRGLI